MKIAFLIPDNRDEFGWYDRPEPVFGPAPDVLLQGFSELVQEAGCEIHVVSCSRKPSKAPEKIYNGRIFYHQPLVSPLGYLKTLYFGCRRAIRSTLRGIRPDIVHAQGTERYCAYAGARSGFPCVVTVHGNMRSIARVNQVSPFSFYGLAARLEEWTLPRVEGVICLSNYTRWNVEDLARRTWVIPNAVEERFFDVQPRRPQDLQLTCVGTICHHKNQNALIRALAPLREEFEFTLNLYGAVEPGTDYTEEFESLLAQYPWVKAHGHVSREKLPEIYANSSLLVIPSLEDNCPMVVLEAMASGIPVLGSRIGGIPDLIHPEKNGWLYESGNVEEFRAMLRKALSSSELLRIFGEEAREFAQQTFMPKQIALNHLDVYREVLSKR